MAEFITFSNDDFGKIRTIVINGEPYFIARDVTSCMGYSDPTKAVRSHISKCNRLVRKFFVQGQMRGMSIINQKGLDELVKSSTMLKAIRLKKWVDDEIIPKVSSGIPFKEKNKLAIHHDRNSPELPELIAEPLEEICNARTKPIPKSKIEPDLTLTFVNARKVEFATGRKYNCDRLKKYCKDAGLGWNRAFDSYYGVVDSYPLEAWKSVYGVEI